MRCVNDERGGNGHQGVNRGGDTTFVNCHLTGKSRRTALENLTRCSVLKYTSEHITALENLTGAGTAIQINTQHCTAIGAGSAIQIYPQHCTGKSGEAGTAIQIYTQHFTGKSEAGTAIQINTQHCTFLNCTVEEGCCNR